MPDSTQAVAAEPRVTNVTIIIEKKVVPEVAETPIWTATFVDATPGNAKSFLEVVHGDVRGTAEDITSSADHHAANNDWTVNMSFRK